MNTAIISDRDQDHWHLNELLEKRQNVICTSYRSAAVFLKVAERKKYDTVILADSTGGYDLAKMARRVHSVSPDSLLILIGEDTKNIRNAFGANVIGYILRSRMKEEFPAVWSDLRREITLTSSVMVRLYNRRVLRVPLSSILYVETVGRKLYMHLKGHRILLIKQQTLITFFAKFRNYDFRYINRACFVNTQNIRMKTPQKVYMKEEDEPLRIGRRYRWRSE